MAINKAFVSFLGKLKTKKISMNIEEEKLQVVDDLAKLMKANRTIVLASIIEAGIPSFFNLMETEWKKLSKDTKKEKKEIATELMKKLQLLKKKHGL